MKKILNQKGSLPLSLIIALIMLMSVITLTTLYLNEKINTSYSAKSDLSKLYEKDTIIEITYNLLKQKMKTKIIEEIDVQEFIDENDLDDIEKVLNANYMPYYKLDKYKAFLEFEYKPPTVDYFCEERIDEESMMFEGFTCLHEAFDMSVKVTLQNQNDVESFILEFDKMYPAVSDTEEEVTINTDEMVFNLTK